MTILQSGVIPSTGGYQIERSLRFNSADSAYLNRTPAGASNRKTWTWSGWVKRGALGGIYQLFAARTGGVLTYTLFYFDTTDTDKIKLLDDGGATLTSSSLYRDPSAWYHIILAVDTTQATSSNRVKIYVNGTQLTAFSTATYPSQNADLNVNSTATHLIGQQASNQYFDGYLTEVNFIDGLALTPSSFGETDSATGVWKPKAFSGTYGTNGFFLKFADNSGTTSTTLGKDSSGNGNNWTPNNFSVTAGAGNDSLVDSPTSYGTDTGVGGEVRGNYCTMNPLNAFGFASGAISNGNLNIGNGNGSVYGGITSTMRIPTSVPIYAEFTVTGSAPVVGITTNNIVGNNASRTFGDSATDWVLITSSGNKENNNSSTSYGSGFSVNDVGMIAVDTANGKVWFGKNGTWFNSGVPASGTNAAFTNVSGEVYVATENDSDDSVTFNFGQRAFAYTAPSGFKALCTQNLPTPTIGATSTTQANDYMNVVLYTGNGTTNAITGVGFQPDFVWLKSRSGATTNHALFDAVRGVGYNLRSNTTEAEAIPSPNDSLTAFNSDGFTLGANANSGAPNINFTVGGTYVSWNWKANGAGSSNTAGSITSTVSANTTSGFSIVTYTGTGSNGATVGHGLGVTPAMMIFKRRNSTGQWATYHSSIGNTGALRLNATSATITDVSFWNNTSPTSTVFTIGVDGDVNTNTGTYVAYCFAPVAGYSAFGSYTGNGSADGPFVYTGFRPRYVMIKVSSTTGSWNIIDTARNPSNLVTQGLYADLADAEDSTRAFDILSNGFKMRSATVANANTATYIYAAFAESPFKYALAR